MKKIITSLFIISGTLSLLGGSLQVNAATKKEVPEQKTNLDNTDIFSDLPDSASILALPDGRFLHGEMKSVDPNDYTHVLAAYNSDTDSKATKVGLIREQVRQETIKARSGLYSGELPLTRGAQPAGLITGVVRGGSIRSHPFSGRGWRFAESNYFAEGSNYLQWQNYGDNGRVGDDEDAWNTYRYGGQRGYRIPNGGGIVNCTPGPGHAVLTYFIYNPNNGTQYIVSNR